MGEQNRNEDKLDEGFSFGNLMDSKTSHLDDELSFKLEKAFTSLRRYSFS